MDWRLLAAKSALHINEPRGTSIFDLRWILVENRLLMSRSVISAYNCAGVAWMLRTFFVEVATFFCAYLRLSDEIRYLSTLNGR